MRYVALLIAITGMAVVQTKFVDKSPAGSPIRLVETVNANKECGITARNIDKRPVVAVVVDFDAGPVGGHMTHDHFFRSDEHVAMYGYEFQIENFPCNTAKVTVTTKFIQFNDGQVWSGSDAKTIADLAFNRREEIDYLNEVIAATDIKAELAKPPQPGKALLARGGEQAVLLNSSDPVATAKDRLANAEAHASWLLDLK